MGGKRIPVEKRAAIAAEAMIEGTKTVIAKAHGVNRKTVDAIKIDGERAIERTNMDFDAILSRYLAETLETLTAQQLKFRDPEWLQRQTAGEMAVLHGVTVDKAIRLFDAQRRAAEAAGARKPTD